MAFKVTDVQKSLAGVEYPASPDDLASHAESNGASSDLVEALRGMDGGELSGPDQVMHELKGQLTGSNEG